MAKVSYLESGDRPVSVRELQDVLLELYEIPEDLWPRYIDAAELANRSGWWDRYSDEDLERAERRYVGLEDSAQRLRAYHPSIFHGLLPTPDYSRANLQVYKTFPKERIAPPHAAAHRAAGRPPPRSVAPACPPGARRSRRPP